MPIEIPKNNKIRKQGYYAIQKGRILGKLKYIVPKEYPEMPLSDIEGIADELLEAYSVEGVKKLTDEELKKMLTIKVDTRKQINVMKQMYRGALFEEKAIKKEEKAIRAREKLNIEAVKKHAKGLNSEQYKTKKSRQALKKTIENNDKLKKKNVKISKKKTKQKSIGKPIFVAAMLGMMTVGGACSICIAGTYNITNQMEEADCFEKGYYPVDSLYDTQIYGPYNMGEPYCTATQYVKMKIPDVMEKGFTEDEAIIGLCNKYGAHPLMVDAKKSNISSRIVTEFKAGTEEISKILKTGKAKGLR